MDCPVPIEQIKLESNFEEIKQEEIDLELTESDSLLFNKRKKEDILINEEIEDETLDSGNEDSNNVFNSELKGEEMW